MEQLVSTEGSKSEEVVYYFKSSVLPLVVSSVSSIRNENYAIEVTGHSLTTSENSYDHFNTKSLTEAISIASQISDVKLIKRTKRLIVEVTDEEIPVK